MRKIIYGINLTIDGCCDHTAGIADDGVLDYFAELTTKADVLLYGRKTYELMFPYWPDVAKDPSAHTRAENDFAKAFTAVPQIVVFSKTLKSVPQNTQILRGNVHDELVALKKQEGRDILIGGVDLPSQLIELGLIDELHVVIHPVIAGKGRRLFDGIDLATQLKLKLVESTPFPSGCVALRFTKS